MVLLMSDVSCSACEEAERQITSVTKMIADFFILQGFNLNIAGKHKQLGRKAILHFKILKNTNLRLSQMYQVFAVM